MAGPGRGGTRKRAAMLCNSQDKATERSSPRRSVRLQQEEAMNEETPDSVIGFPQRIRSPRPHKAPVTNAEIPNSGIIYSIFFH